MAVAKQILGKPFETLKKWRQRRQGPKFIRYQDGSVRYLLSTILKFMEDCTVKW